MWSGIAKGQPARWALLVLAGVIALCPPAARAGPAEPDHPPLIGTPQALARYWHDQRWVPGDAYACALYAQASVMHAQGYDFQAELDAMRALGQRDGWYDPRRGAIGLGQPFRARAIPYRSFGSPLDDSLTHDRALYRLMRELSAGRYVIVNVDAQILPYYHGSAIQWHTLWITGLRLDAAGRVTTIIANDSYRGPAVAYAVEDFLDAWASDFNYYGIFVQAHAHTQ
jgi:hypothetical protein